jgi:C_GCAxxG_C_C family probable redox protein
VDTPTQSPHASPEAVGAEAGRLFGAGFYCAESVLLAVARAHDLETPELSRLATGLCSGMSRSGGPCGALSGGILALGLLLGREYPEEAVAPCYAASQQLIASFQQRWGSTACFTLLDCDLSSEHGRQQFKDRGLKEKVCVPATRWAAATVQEILLAPR